MPKKQQAEVRPLQTQEQFKALAERVKFLEDSHQALVNRLAWMFRHDPMVRFQPIHIADVESVKINVDNTLGAINDLLKGTRGRPRRK